MKALILAAGEGTRLRPLTLTRPKPMLPVGGEPLLSYIVRWLHWHHIDQIAINLNYLPRIVTDYIGDGSRFGAEVTYSHEDPILGSAGAAKKLESYWDSDFLVVYGDMLLDVDISPLLELHAGNAADLSIALFHAQDPSAVGVVALDEGERVRRFVEKPREGEIEGDLAAAGIYVVNPAVLRFVPAGAFYDFGRDLVPQLLREGARVYGRVLGGYMLDIGTPEAYERAQADVKGLGKHWERALS